MWPMSLSERAHAVMYDERVEALEEALGLEATYARAIRAVELREERKRQSANPGGLMHFIRYFWHIVEPTKKFVDGWVLDAMCAHLEAVDRGEIQKLLITVPPGSMKSLLCSVFFPLWQWGPREKPSLRYLNFAYASHLTERDNGRMLLILKSREWRELWGDRREQQWVEAIGKYVLVRKGFTLTAEGQQKIATSKTGWKLATSVSGVGTGERADCVLLDDPHSIKDDTSEVVRPETVRWFKEAMSNRLNDMEASVIIAIMQRSHEADVAGEILRDDMGYVHLNIPAAYEREQHCVTRLQTPSTLGNSDEIFWEDPRTEEGENYWPERLSRKVFRDLQKPSNAHVWISQYQQRPEPRGGAVIKRAYWRNYVPKNGKWPKFEYVIASLDSAFTEKTHNDPSGFTVWGVFMDAEGSMCALLLMAWRKWLTLGGVTKIRPKRREESWANYKAETEKDWGIVQWMNYEGHRFKIDNLLIENKANGKDVYNELRKHSKFNPWAMTLIDPKNLDKLARIHRVHPIFAEGLIYAIVDKSYAKLAIDEAAVAPNGKYRDITDTTTQALWYLRKMGYLEHVENAVERQRLAAERAGKKPKGKKALYGA